MNRTLLIDFDGTLLDTSVDIAMAVNRQRKAYGFSEMKKETVIGHVGHGVVNLLTKCLPESDLPMEQLEKDFLISYHEIPSANTTKYHGLDEFLNTDGHKKIVFSNKSESLLKAILKELDMEKHFSHVVGGDSCQFRKPEKGMLDWLKNTYGLQSENFLMIGDDRPDVELARNCGIPVIYCEFGFRGKQTIWDVPTAKNWFDIQELLKTI